MDDKQILVSALAVIGSLVALVTFLVKRGHRTEEEGRVFIATDDQRRVDLGKKARTKPFTDDERDFIDDRIVHKVANIVQPFVQELGLLKGEVGAMKRRDEEAALQLTRLEAKQDECSREVKRAAQSGEDNRDMLVALCTRMDIDVPARRS